MSKQLHPLLRVLKQSPEYNRLNEILTEAEGPASAFGLPEAHRAHVFAALCERRGGLLIAASEQAADRLYSIASAFSDKIALLPARELPLVNAYAASGEGAKRRIATLTRLSLNEPVGVIASIEAVLQRLAPQDVLKRAIHTVKLGEAHPPRELLRALTDAGYEPVELVEGPGQASLRGDILDVFPPHAREPYRIEFFDDEVDRMSIFDPATQRSLSRVEEALLPPATEAPQDAAAIARALKATKGAKGFDAQRIAWEEKRACLGAEILLPVLYENTFTILDHLPKNAPLFLEEPHRVEEAASAAYRLFTQSVSAMLARGEGISEQIGLLTEPHALFARLNTPRTALLFTLARSFSTIHIRESVQFDARIAPHYPGGREELARDIALSKKTGGTVLLYAGAHAQRLQQQLLDEDCEVGLAESLSRELLQGEALLLSESLPQGFLYPSIKLTVLSEAELFGYAKHAAKKRHSDKPRLVFSELKPGDYVVHEAHGVGRFLGVEALTVQDTTRDYLLMEYQSGDRLYIPTDQLDRVQKYIGSDDEPRLSKLGGSEWQKQVSRARSAVKELAFDLAKLYAERQQTKGFSFSPDSQWQKQLEENFPYTETPDQLQCIEDIKRDMESSRVMDRLLCGDVGYGKTEVALRAAFKAVQDSKQVAVLVPTTVLAQQHYNTLSTRFSSFPVRVALLSRFKTPLEQKAVKKALTEGTVDIVVGTHALLSKEVKFKDLGLLIVDEEQRFGVGHKEQIKNIKTSVDVLTLTATPIPRTLHMSMIGIRDMSVIETPPEDRFPVQTYVLEYSETLLCDAVNKELSRGGQCYIVYNQVQRLERYAAHLKELLPDAAIAVAHGQMPEHALERVMLDFMEGRYNVLLCSTIIENGLDISNANTMFVLDSDKMGLSQLYQLRGRVGRSTRLGYAYFMFERDKSLTEVAHKRLSALTEFAQFGAGREIALRDLEIRGAGSLLGAQQHGHIADIGYEYYTKLMGQAIKEARGEITGPPEVDTVIDIPIDAHIPKWYIKSEVQRLSMYKRIALISDRAMLYDVQEEVEDRFGNIPEATQNLIDTAYIKALASRSQASGLTVREGFAKLVFHADAQLDGARLVTAATNFGAQLVPGETTALVFRKAGADVVQMLQALPPFLEELCGCV